MSIVFPVIVRSDYGDLQLLGSENNPTHQFEPIDIENLEFTLWDADGRGVSAHLRDGNRRVILEYDERGDDRDQLRAHIRRYADTLGWSKDADALLSREVPMHIVVRYLELASKSKKKPGSGTI